MCEYTISLGVSSFVFVLHFLSSCHSTSCGPSHHSVRQWSEHRFKGLLVNRGDVTVSNRVFELRVSQPTRLFLGVHQEDSRVQGVSTLRPYLDLGAVVFQKKANNKIKVVDQVPLELDRQAQAELELQPGTYLVMPRSTGCRFQQEEGASRDPHPFFRSGGQAADPDFLSIMHDIFRKYDVGMNQRLGFQELAVLVHDAGEPDLSPDQWDSLWHSFCGSEEGIPFRGVMAWILTGGKEVSVSFLFFQAVIVMCVALTIARCVCVCVCVCACVCACARAYD